MYLNGLNKLHVGYLCSFVNICLDVGQWLIISLTGLSALSIALCKPTVIVTSLALDFERGANWKVISIGSPYLFY